jgi:hypothetical protein
MIKLLPIFALLIFAASAPIQAGMASDKLESSFQSALNEMVQQVRNTGDAAHKRVLLQTFVDRMQDGLQTAEGMQSISPQDRKSLDGVLGKFDAYQAELYGRGDYERVPDAGLDDFASYIRQNMEQAPIGGGIYISGAALIVILILLLILIR